MEKSCLEKQTNKKRLWKSWSQCIYSQEAENDKLYHSDDILPHFSFSAQDVNPKKWSPQHPEDIFLLQSSLSENALRDMPKFLSYSF